MEIKRTTNNRKDFQKKIEQALAKKPTASFIQSKGITPENLQKIVGLPSNIIPNKKMKYYNANRNNQAVFFQSPEPPAEPLDRPTRFLSTLIKNDNVTTLELPDRGAFNAGLIAFQDKYICVYRSSEYQFRACFLDKNLKVDQNSLFTFEFSNCADPRLIWSPDGKKLITVFSSTDEGFHYEFIRGCVLMDLDKSDQFINTEPFRISPKDLGTRQKNWMPFVLDNRIFLTGSVCPHIVYEFKFGESEHWCDKISEFKWHNPWMYKAFLRGNTNAVRLDDGNFLGTFHTAMRNISTYYYDNGAYLFEGKPPFRVLKCSNKTYLKAEDAIYPHFRKRGEILVNFPVGLVKENNNLLISYGDNDSCVKILKTTVDEVLSTMVDVY